jgi:hypothetical protein
MRKFFAWVFLLIGIFCLVAPQSLMGLRELKFLYKTSFAGEVILGMVLTCVSYYLFDFRVKVPEEGGKH